MRTSTNQKGFTVIEALLIMVIVAIIGGTGYYVYHSNTQANKNYKSSEANATFAKNKAPSNFAECKAAKGSVILQTSPEQCKTKAGKTFTETTKAAAEPVDDKTAILAAAKAYTDKFFTQDGSTTPPKLTYNVDNIVGSNALGSTSADVGDPGVFVAHKDNNGWQIVHYSHLNPNPDVCSKYGMPSNWCMTY